jgi:hypothetical protein
MKTKLKIVKAAGALALLALAGCCATKHHATTDDYRIIRGHIATGNPPLETQLSQAAAEGWHVVSTGSDDGVAFIVLRKAR